MTERGSAGQMKGLAGQMKDEMLKQVQHDREGFRQMKDEMLKQVQDDR